MNLRTARIPAYRVLVLVLVALTGWPTVAQDRRPDKQAEIAEFVKANYTKYEYRVPMRDGVHLFTAVYVPKDASETNPYPILFERTPYSVGPYGVDNYPRTLGPTEQLLRSKYIFVYQDVRGRFMSEGEFVNMRPHNPAKRARTDIDESTDTYDTIEWLIKNVPHNNGKVGMWGISYPGFYVAAGMIDAHPALKAVSPQAPINDWFLGDDFHHHGALWLPHFFNFISVFGQPRPQLTTKWGQRFDPGTPDGYNFFLRMEPLELANQNYLKHNVAFWDELIQHPNYDAFWKARSLTQHLKNIKPAVMVVGGWFDAENLYGALHTYEATARNNPGGPVTLIVGPWFHGGWSRSEGDKLGDVSFGAHTSAFYRESIEAPFFEFHLKGKPDPKLPAAFVFETGSNQWRRYDSWPPKSALKKTLYFGPNGSLSFDAPSAGAGSYDEYMSDPNKPVPYFDKPNTGMAREYMSADQRLQGRRTDVLVYQTEPLQQEVTVAGPVAPTLWVSTTGTDSDWVVKLIDVYPPEAGNLSANPWEQPPANEERMGDYEQLVRGEAMRGRFRNSYEKPEPFEPGKVTKVEFVEPDAYHTFRTGHRIMVQVQSTWFPLVDLNPQKFVPNIYEAKREDFQKATQRVYHSREAQSHVDVLVLGK